MISLLAGISQGIPTIINQYKFGSDSSSTNFVDEQGVKNLSNQGTAVIKAVFPSYNVANSGTPSSFQSENNGAIDTQGLSFASMKSMGFWMNFTTTGLQAGNDGIFFIGSATTNRFQLTANAGNYWGFGYYNAVWLCGPDTKLIDYVTDEEWHYYVINFNGSHVVSYVDSVMNHSIACAYDGSDIVIGGTSSYFLHVAGGGYFTNNFDELNLYDDILNQSLINNLYSYGNFTAPAASKTLNISSYSPPNQSQFNEDNIDFSVNVQSASIFNCTLYINNTINQTDNNNAAGDDIDINFTVSFDNNTVNVLYEIMCDNNVDNDTTDVNIIYYDPISPYIVTNLDNNDTIAYNYLNSVINFSDLNLFSINISINGDNKYELNDINVTELSLNISFNVTNYTIGYNNITICAKDGHTAQYIQNYNVLKDINKKSLKYQYDKNYVEIAPKIQSNFNNN